MDYNDSLTLESTSYHERPLAPSGAGVGATDLTSEALDEALVTDVRAGLTPAQMVERKLVSLLKTNPLPVSQLMTESRSLRVR